MHNSIGNLGFRTLSQLSQSASLPFMTCYDIVIVPQVWGSSPSVFLKCFLELSCFFFNLSVYLSIDPSVRFSLYINLLCFPSNDNYIPSFFNYYYFNTVYITLCIRLMRFTVLEMFTVQHRVMHHATSNYLRVDTGCFRPVCRLG